MIDRTDLHWLDHLTTRSSKPYDIDEKVDRLFIDNTLQANTHLLSKRQHIRRTKPQKKIQWSKILLPLLSIALVIGLLATNLPIFYGGGDFEIKISIEPADLIEGDFVYLNATIPAYYNITQAWANIPGIDTINLSLIDNTTAHHFWQGTWLFHNLSAGDHIVNISAVDFLNTSYYTLYRWSIASNASENETITIDSESITNETVPPANITDENITANATAISITDSREEHLYVVPGTRFSVERTVDGPHGTEVIFVPLFSDALTFEYIEIFEDNKTTEQQKKVDFTATYLYTADKAKSITERKIDNLRQTLPSHIRELDQVAYSNSFELHSPRTVRIWFKAPSYEDIQSGAKPSSGHISYLVFTNDDNMSNIGYDYEGSTWWSSSWGYRKLIIINSSQVDADLTNFPILVNTTDTDLRDKAQNDGDDIAFVSWSDNSTQLNHEIELFNGTSGELISWVNVTSLSSSVDTKIWMYYNNSACSSQENPEGVWDSNHIGVYHLGDLTASTIEDSTSNNNNGTKTGANEPVEEDGKMGKCQHFDGNNDVITASLGTLDAPYTVELWGYFDNLNQPNGDYDYFMMLRDSAGTGTACSMSRWNGDGGANEDKFYNYDGSVRYGPVLQGQQWLYVVLQMTTSGDYSILYINGTEQNLDASTSQRDSNGALTIGEYATAHTHQFDGKLDEVRVSNIIRNSSWISASHNTTNNPSTFLSFGSEEQPAPELGNPVPSNGATSVSVPPSSFNITISDLNGDNMNITWRTNESGSWVTFNETNGSGSGVGNGTYNVTNTSWVGSNLTKYWWSVNVTDGYGWTNNTYSFTTRPQNYVPTISNVYPSNGSTGIDLQVTCHIQANDLDADTMTAYWYNSTDGTTFTHQQTNGSVTSGDTVYWTYTQANSYLTTYYWKVAVNDTKDNTTAWYNFTSLSGDTTKPSSNVTAITPYWYSSSDNPLTITCTDAEDNTGGDGLKNVTLYYHNSTDNSTWSGPWKFGVDENPWVSCSWSFTFPNSTGYYRFYSRAADNASPANIEDPPVTNDTICGYDVANPTSTVGAISPYELSFSPLTITASASDSHTSVKNVTLWYRYSTDNSSWGSEPNWWNNNWNHYRTITIDHTKIDSDIINFPVLVKINSTIGARCDGGDSIRFLNTDNSTEYYYEIDEWDDSGDSYVWVNITSVSSTQNTVFLMYYNNSNAADDQHPENVWNANYTVVYHLGDLTTSTIEDSTSNNNNGTKTGANEPVEEDGKIGKCQHFDGNNDIITASLGTLDAPYTVEVWGYFDNLNQPNDDYDYFMMLGHASDAAACSMSRERGNSGANSNKFYNWDGTAQRFGPVLQGQQWLYVVLQMTTSGDYSILYINGTEQNLDASTSQRDSNGALAIGEYATGSSHWLDGKIDEFRVSNILINASWINASFENQNGTASFLTIGVEEGNEPWMQWNDASNPDTSAPWNWSFNFSDGTGYYEFYSIAVDNVSNTENAPDTADARCKYDISPPSISFDTPPTPVNNSQRTQNWVQVNVTISDISNTSSFIDWDKSLAGYWNFYEGSGTTAHDNSTYSRNGTLYNMVDGDWVTGKFGIALNFKDATDYIDLGPTNDIIGDNCQEVTISAWIKSTDTSSQYPVALKRSASHSTLISLNLNNGDLGFLTRNYADTAHDWIWATDKDYGDGEWHHIVATVNGMVRTLYIDGDLKDSDNDQGMQNVSGNTAYACIGAFSSNSIPFNGLIDEVQVWTRALSYEEVNASYNSKVNKLYHNFTGLSSANYSYYAHAIDVLGNENTTETRNVTINTKPTIGLIFPSPNGTTGVGLQPICSIWANDTGGDNLTVYWYNSTDGTTFTYQQTNNSVTSGDIVNWIYTQANKYSTTYYWKVAVNDSVSNVTAQYYFTTVTETAPYPPSSFIVISYNETQINLSWTMGTRADYTRIQQKTGGYPSSISDGANAYNGTGTSCNDGGLSETVTYYYRAWSWNETNNEWSANYTSGSNTTLSVKPSISFDTPPTPANNSQGTQNWVQVNVTVSDISNTSAFFDWNGSLRGYWSMEYYNSTGVYDNSTYDNFGNFGPNGPSSSNITTGKYGNALEFDGNDDYVDTPLEYNLSGNGAFSVFAWVKDIPSGNMYVICQAHDLSSYSSDWILGYQNNGLWFRTMTIDGGNQLGDGDWHHFGFTFDGTDAKLYIDGSQHGGSITPAGYGADVGATVKLMTRGDASSGFVSGSLDEVCIFSRALSQEEINASYNNGLYKLYHNFTGLSVGNYSYYAHAIDVAGNENTTETRYVEKIIETSVDKISPYEVISSPLTINATGPASLSNVTLWYHYSGDNSTWWNTSWTYRKQCNISNNLDDYQMKIVVGNSSGGNVTCDGYAQSDFGDIRFINSTGNELPYWRENYTVDTQATFWINNSYNDSKIWMYYGNSAASTTSNGTNTFIFFDGEGFGGSIDWTNKWASDDQSSYTISGGDLRCAWESDNTEFIRTKSDYDETARLRVKWKFTHGVNWANYLYWGDGTSKYSYDNAGDWTTPSHAQDDLGYRRDNDTNNVTAGDFGIDDSAYYIVDFRVDDANVDLRLIQDGDVKTSITGSDAKNGYDRYLKILNYWSSTYIYVNFVTIGKYNVVEPTWNSFGGEEFWMAWNNASQNPDTGSPWSWNFTFPNGTGYYEFYSIGKKTGSVDETPPGSADAICHYPENTSFNVTPSQWNIGTIDIGDTNATTGFYFNLTNEGNVALDITINATNATNTTTPAQWNLTTTPGHDNFSLQYNLSSAGTWTSISTSFTSFVTDLAINSWKTFDLKLLMATTSSTVDPMEVTVTFKSVAS